MRDSFGRSDGGAKRGCSPPTASTNVDPEPEPQRARNAIAPVSAYACASRESMSMPSTATLPWSKSMTPTVSTTMRTRSLSCEGSSALTRPSTSNRLRTPNSTMTASCISTSVGVNHPILASRPTR